jgi:GTP-binding protein Era
LKNIRTPIFLLINKVDIIKKEKILLIIDKYKDLMNFAEIIPISALRGISLDLLEKKIYEYLPEAEKICADDEVPVQSQRFLLAEIIREKLLSHVMEELPFVTAVYIDTIEDRAKEASPGAEPKKATKYIRATIFVEKESHRRIVIGRQGKLIKTIGTQARRELEQILGARIFLDLWVKVKEKWRDSADVLDLIESQ